MAKTPTVVDQDEEFNFLEKPENLNALEEMSFDELMARAVVQVAEIDDTTQVDKGELVGKPFIIIDWEIKEGDKGEYAVIRGKTPEGGIVFADGSTGILQQLKKYEYRLKKSGQFTDVMAHGLFVPHGLRASTYMTEVDGRQVQATTYYLDNRRK